MAQMQTSQSVALQLEKARDKLPLLYERDDILLTMIQQREDVERVSSRNMRLPLQIRPGGKAGLANLDGDDLGRGSGTTSDVAQVSPIFFGHVVEITKLVEYSTNAPEKAIENAAKREVKNAMGQFRAFLDKLMQTNGNGVLGTVGSIVTTGLPAGVVAQINLTTPPGAALFYYNQTIQCYDTTLTTPHVADGCCTTGDQQSAESVGHESGGETGGVHGARAGKRLGAAWHFHLADHQGRSRRARERSRLALHGRADDGGSAD
jgi:hypothetical protein